MSSASRFGAWLKQLRQNRGLTQEALAEHVGCATQTIRKIEGGQRRPSYQIAARLAAVLSLSPEERANFTRLSRGESAPGGEPAEIVAEIQPATELAPAEGLPQPPTRLIGREQDLLQAQQRVLSGDVRLLTLLGPGGVGKTRLAVELASRLKGHFADGVVFVNLVPIRDPSLVVRTIADAVGIGEEGGRTRFERLIDGLRTQHLLLALDNFEQVIPAAGAISELLWSCPGLTVLVTSRELLHVRGEHLLAVPPLPVHDYGRVPSGEQLRHSAAVQLFAERAAAVRPDFVLTDENVRVVAEICRRLDGLPLAIELAAARIRLFPPDAILARLGSRLALLTQGPRDVPEHQQTMRQTIAWSYDLLMSAEQALFRRLCVFVGGCTLEAIAAVFTAAGEFELDVFEGLASLSDKSLVLQDAPASGEPCFRMLETIREFGLEQLQRSGDAKAMCRAHAHYYLGLAERSEPNLWRGEQQYWLDRLEAEHDNLRAALAWHVAQDDDGASALRMAGRLWRFWDVRGHWTEGLQWLEQALARRPGAAPEHRWLALHGAGNMALNLCEYERAQAHYEESLAVTRDLQLRHGIANSLLNLSLAIQYQGDLPRAISLQEEALAIHEELGNRIGIALTLTNLASMFEQQGDYDRAAELAEASLTSYQELGDSRGMAWALHHLGTLARRRGEYDRARSLLEECKAIYERLGARRDLARALHNQGELAADLGDVERAAELYEASLSIAVELRDRDQQADILASQGRLTQRLSDEGGGEELRDRGLAPTRDPAERPGLNTQPSKPRPPLIGRGAQLAAAEEMIARIEAGEPGPHTLLISGEAGVGKSRLLTALRDRCSPTWHVLAASCEEPYQSEPYGPLSDMLPRALAGLSHAERGMVIGASAPALAMLPSLEHLVPRDAAPLTPATAHNQRRVTQALAETFTRLAALGPTLITVEDLHWCDAATLALLPQLAYALSGRPALLALTYRDDEVQPLLAAALADLGRRRLAFELALPRLSRDDMEAQVRALVGSAQSLSSTLLDTLYSLTDGNPYLVEEVVTAVMAAGSLDDRKRMLFERSPVEWPIPRSLQEPFARRIACLSPPAQKLLTLAAALGRRFDFALLHCASDWSEADLIPLLKELIASRLLIEEAPDQFAFRQALGRFVVSGSLFGRERRALHHRLAEALERSSAESYVADLAQHFLQAGVWEKALQYAQTAADHARQRNAQHEVVAHLSVALEAVAHFPGRSPIDLLIARADAAYLQAHIEAARADLQWALGQAEARAQPAEIAQVLLKLGALWTARDNDQAGASFAMALTHAKALADPALLARSLNAVGSWQIKQERPLIASAMHAEALAIFERLGDHAGQAESLELLGVSQLFAADVTSAQQTLERARACSRTQHDLHSALRTAPLNGLLVLAGYEPTDSETIPANLASLERLLLDVRQLGQRVYEPALEQLLGGTLIQLGEFGRAHDYLSSSVAISAELGYHEWHAYGLAWLTQLALEQYDLDGAAQWAERAWSIAKAARSTTLEREVGHKVVRVRAAQGAFAEADDLLAALLPPPDEPLESSLMLRRLRLARAELALARGSHDEALAEVDALIATAHNPAKMVLPALWYVRGAALAELRRYDEANAVLAEGFAAAQAGGRRPLASRILAARAAVAIGQRRRAEAATLLDEAHALIDALCATLHEPALRAGFRQRARAALPALPLVTPRQAIKHVFDGLTDRELDVARLIAQGYSNRQIAEALGLSERTVGAHVGNILTKLGLRSRLQVASWAVEKGIAL
jgi:predicted ATPase/DNA-binding CsgD family transcriptional regulator/DNA-binding XRE family transcriptional regulator